MSLETSAMRHRLAQSNSLSLTFYRDSHTSSIRRRATVSGSDKNDSVGVYSVAWTDVKKELVEGLGEELLCVVTSSWTLPLPVLSVFRFFGTRTCTRRTKSTALGGVHFSGRTNCR